MSQSAISSGHVSPAQIPPVRSPRSSLTPPRAAHPDSAHYPPLRDPGTNIRDVVEEHVRAYLLRVFAIPGANRRLSTHDSISRSALVAYCGAVCASTIAAALTLAGSTSLSPILEAAITCGAIGSLFVMAALAYGQHPGGRYYMRLSILCSAVGTALIVAAMRAWVATLGTCICIVVTFWGILQSGVLNV